MAATPRFTTRQDLPYLIERGRATVLTCPVYYQGAEVYPTGGTVNVIDENGSTVATGSLSSGVTPEITVTTSASVDLSARWRVEWTLTGVTNAPGALFFHSSAHHVRARLYPTISDADIAKRVPALATSFAGRPTVATSYQDAIEEADTEVQRRLIANSRRPWLIVEPWALRECWLTAALSVIFEGLAAISTEEGPYLERARYWREQFEAEYTKASVLMDWDEDGDADSDQRTSLRRGSVWTT